MIIEDLLWETVEEAIEDTIKHYINLHLDIAAATGLDQKTIDQVRNLHLAEPNLPAVEIMNLVWPWMSKTA